MRGVLRILDRSGDTAIEWDTEDRTKPSPEQMDKEFKRLVSEGHLAFVNTSTPTKRQAEQIKKFDPQQDEIIFSPAFVGG